MVHIHCVGTEVPLQCVPVSSPAPLFYHVTYVGELLEESKGSFMFKMFTLLFGGGEYLCFSSGIPCLTHFSFPKFYFQKQTRRKFHKLAVVMVCQLYQISLSVSKELVLFDILKIVRQILKMQNLIT